MSSSAGYVLDTHTLVSAVVFEHSTPGQALRRALKRGEILVSPSTLEELAEVLQREKFDRTRPLPSARDSWRPLWSE